MVDKYEIKNSTASAKHGRLTYSDPSLMKTRSQAVARIADRTAKNCSGYAHFQGNYVCACSAFPIQSCMPNLKSLAQTVFEILRSKRIGVTSLTFQDHVRSSVIG